MLRYIIGISVAAALIIIVRKLSDGKILKKHQYALWLLIPVYMIVSPFLKIDLPILEAPAVTAAVQTESVGTDNNTENLVIEQVQPDDNGQTQTVYPEVHQDYEREIIAVDTGSSLNIVDLVKTISLSVSAILIVGFIVYNIGFVLYCRRKRYFIRQDQTSGLKIYAIKFKGTPFLLFNKIYVDEMSDGSNECIICHEVCHYMHRDPMWIVLRYLVLALNWYNPLIWAAFYLSGVDCELACDEEVIRLLGKKRSAEYAMSLYEILTQQSEAVIGFTVSTGMRSEFKTMKRRIASIKTPAKKSYKVLALCMVILAVFSGCTLLNPTSATREDDVASNAPFGDISNARVRLSNNGIIPCVFDADENAVKELAQVFNASEWQEAGVDFPHGLDGEGVNVFVNKNGEYYQLCFRAENYVRVQRYGDTNTKLYKVSSEADAAAWKYADPEGSEGSPIPQEQWIQMPVEDFTPEGVWKHGLSDDQNSVFEGESTSVKITDDIIPDDYIKDEVMKDGEYGGRAYKDQLLLHLNGKEYIAVGDYSQKKYMDIGELSDGIITYTDDDLKNLNIGDEFVYDRDIRFTIKSLDVDEDWYHKDDDKDDPSYLNGKIRIGDNYSLIHDSLDFDEYDSGIITDGRQWILADEKVSNEIQDTRLFIVDNVKLIEYSDNCKFELLFNGKLNTENGVMKINKDRLSSVFEEYVTPDRSFCRCRVFIKDNKVVKLVLDVNDA